MEHYGQQTGPFIASMAPLAYVKKPSPVHLMKVDSEFDVETVEGLMHGNPGDWLAYDPLSGHVWVITDEYKNMHYERITESVHE